MLQSMAGGQGGPILIVVLHVDRENKAEQEHVQTHPPQMGELTALVIPLRLIWTATVDLVHVSSFNFYIYLQKPGIST